jgi:hypothetical protein
VLASHSLTTPVPDRVFSAGFWNGQNPVAVLEREFRETCGDQLYL